MATAERDYYELLGIARAASEAEVKSAFRRLARELHPDVSDTPDEQRFREIAEAYDVLSNAESRRLYDRFGTRLPQNGGSMTAGGGLAAFEDLLERLERMAPRRGEDVAATVEIELVEAASGVTRRVAVDALRLCATCDGLGREPGVQLVACTTCHGKGLVRQVARNRFGEFGSTGQCPRCDGNGRTPAHPCRGCDGAGRKKGRTLLDVEIRPGVRDGAVIRLRGAGHAGVNGAPAGDAVLTVRVRPHPRLERRGDDLHTSVRLTMTQAARGAIVSVATLEGETELALDHGTQPAEVVVLRGKGMPALPDFRCGDLHVRIDVAVPRALTREQRRMVDELEQALGADAYA